MPRAVRRYEARLHSQHSLRLELGLIHNRFESRTAVPQERKLSRLRQWQRISRRSTDVREFAVSLLERLGTVNLSEARAIGNDAGLASLKEQAVLGGVLGL